MATVLVAVSHPDDEALYCGGTIRRLADAGHRVAVLMLTSGENGRTLGMCAQDELAVLRAGEARAAAAALGVERLTILGFPDGGLAAQGDELSAAVAGELERLKPSAVFTFPPNGVNGHLDHVAAHQAVTCAVQTSREPGGELHYFASPAEFAEPVRPGFLHPAEVARMSLATTASVDAQEALAAKLSALGHYESQARSVVKFMRLYPDRIIAESFHLASGPAEGNLLSPLA
ncbi:MAG: PIG-L family deacetylase [Dactylosporangium sp.]|nr:PIG-L family deacetylase [Dactylosporangium sp.]NNJ62166.1 PIG-L family deacetylase [Dactylosporangium sp.]